MLTATVNSGVYHLLFLLHMLAVIVGFGGLVLKPAYTSHAARTGGREGAAIAGANSEISKLALYALYSVPVWGIGLIGASGKVWKFSSPWVSLAFVLWFVAVGVVHGVLVPSQHKLKEVLVSAANGTGAPPAVGEVKMLNSRLAIGGGALNLLLVVILVLMIWKPGQ